MVRLASGLVLGGDIENTIGVDVEGDLNPRDTSRGRRNAGELELAEEAVVIGAGTPNLLDLDEDTRLVVCLLRYKKSPTSW